MLSLLTKRKVTFFLFVQLLSVLFRVSRCIISPAKLYTQCFGMRYNVFLLILYMRSSDIFREYVWLVRTIWRAGRISLEEISRKWELSGLSGGRRMSRSTFNRHRAAIEEIYGLTIECDRSCGNTYHIKNAESIFGNSTANWITSVIAVNNLVAECQSIQERILLESIPSSVQTLHKVVEAMKENRVVEVTYKSYGYSSKKYRLEPYCIRLYRQRWYLLGHFDNKFRLFSFDRIETITLTNTLFSMEKSFNPNDFFADFFGIWTDFSVKPRRIVLRVYGKERYYVRDLPLHHSQTIISETEDTDDIELYLRPTPDFFNYIFSKAGQIEIISPAEIKQQYLEWSISNLSRMISPDKIPY